MEFDWDEANILHLARHDITPDEAMQVIENGTVFIDFEFVDGEPRTTETGHTLSGRFLTLITTERETRTRVATGWDATKAQRIAYLESLDERE